MSLDTRAVALFVACSLVPPLALRAEPRSPQRPSSARAAVAPEPVSPRGPVALACPTFSWSAAPGAPGYELVVYAVGEEGEVGEEPLLSARLPGGASSWTPPGRRCLDAGGRFAWSLRVAGSEAEPRWSAPTLFQVAAAPSMSEVQAAIDTLRRYLAESRDEDPEPSGSAPSRPAAGRAEAPPRLLPDLRPAGRGRPSAPEPRELAGALDGKAAPSLGAPSLTLDGSLALGAASHLFKEGALFLWDDTDGNTALGRLALASAAGTATGNTAVGTGALTATTGGVETFHGSANTAVGYQAMGSNSIGSSNAALGAHALAGNLTGTLNSAVGNRALASNTSGHRNTAAGAFSLQYTTTGTWNTAMGVFALRNNTTGSSNTAIGYKALHQATGTGNVALGFHAGLHATDGDDNVFIANSGGSEDSGTIRIGSTVHDRTFIEGIHGEIVAGNLNEMTVLVDSSGKLGTQVSSRRFKEGIASLGDASRPLLELRPVRFRYTEQEGRGPEHFGLIAEEVAEVFPELVVRDAEGRPLSVRYHLLAPLLLAELQRAHREIEAVRTGLESNCTQLEAVRERLAAGERSIPPVSGASSR